MSDRFHNFRVKMTITIHSYTIYHSPNACLGTVLLAAVAEAAQTDAASRPAHIDPPSSYARMPRAEHQS
jgi:hypothetical protein